MAGITIGNIKDWPPEKFETALRETIESTSPVDALIATTRRLKEYEQKYDMTSEEFYAQFMSGELGNARGFRLGRHLRGFLTPAEWKGDG